MDLVKNTNEKVEKIYWYIFEWGMEQKYSTKEELNQAQKLQDEKTNQMKKDIEKHDAVISKLGWMVITGVIVFIASSVVSLIVKFW